MIVGVPDEMSPPSWTRETERPPIPKLTYTPPFLREEPTSPTVHTSFS